MANPIIRQGDVLLVPVNDIPAAAKPVSPEAGRLILARGEATGHHHSIGVRGATMFRDDGGGSYVQIIARVVFLEHQEHSALVVPRGVYQVRIQRTVQSGMARRVAD